MDCGEGRLQFALALALVDSLDDDSQGTPPDQLVEPPALLVEVLVRLTVVEVLDRDEQESDRYLQLCAVDLVVSLRLELAGGLDRLGRIRL